MGLLGCGFCSFLFCFFLSPKCPEDGLVFSWIVAMAVAESVQVNNSRKAHMPLLNVYILSSP